MKFNRNTNMIRKRKNRMLQQKKNKSLKATQKIDAQQQDQKKERYNTANKNPGTEFNRKSKGTEECRFNR